MTNNIKRKAVILVSGGLDSATVLAIAQNLGFDLYAISFDYGQRHQFELQAAKKVCDSLKVKKQISFELDLRAFGGSALTDEIEVPKDRNEAEMEVNIPITYVPARNTIFLSIAMGWAETLGIEDIFLGVNSVDYSGYPDCRPEFIQAFQNVANLATKSGVEGKDAWKIHTPLISMTKSDIIKKGLSLGVNYGLTHSCYDPDSQGFSCGRCDSCKLRLKGFEEANSQDPITYQ